MVASHMRLAGLANSRLQHLTLALRQSEDQDPLPLQHGDATGRYAYWSTVPASRRLARVSNPPASMVPRLRQWRKVHLGIDADTLDVHAIKVTDSRVGDCPCCPKCWRRPARGGHRHGQGRWCPRHPRLLLSRCPRPASAVVPNCRNEQA